MEFCSEESEQGSTEKNRPNSSVFLLLSLFLTGEGCKTSTDISVLFHIFTCCFLGGDGLSSEDHGSSPNTEQLF